MIKFKERTEKPEGIKCVFNPTYANKTVDEIEVEMKRKGRLNVGYHYVLSDTGDLQKALDNKLYADYSLDGYKKYIYVLVAADNLTDAADSVLKKLSETLSLPLINE